MSHPKSSIERVRQEKQRADLAELEIERLKDLYSLDQVLDEEFYGGKDHG